MKFAKWVFWIAGIWGVLVLVPLYFALGFIARRDPPAVNHLQFFFGFIGVGLAWQAAFFVIGSDPGRFRALMIPAVLEKWIYVASICVLHSRGLVTAQQSASAIPDFVWGVFFLIAFWKTRAAAH
jgi:predicted tellurium resistance membrane protein TerC